MSKRLQILLGQEEYERIRAISERSGVTMAEWARQALRGAASRVSDGDVGRKLRTVRAALQHSFPTADIDQVLRDIESGYTHSGGD